MSLPIVALAVGILAAPTAPSASASASTSRAAAAPPHATTPAAHAPPARRAAAAPAPAPKAAPPPPPARLAVTGPFPTPEVHRLPNGLTIVMVPWDSPGVVSYYTVFRAGSRDEVEPGKSGYAHLFEHLTFRGTDRMPAEEYQRRMQALGVDDNALTNEDSTVYVPTAAKDALPELVSVNAERFEHLSYSKNAYKDETGAVLGEYNKSAASPVLAMEDALAALAFTRHTYGHTALGLRRDVEAMPDAYDYSRTFFQRYYTPDDCAVIVVGDFDASKAAALIEKAYGGWTGRRAVTHAPVEPEQLAPRSKAIEWNGPTAPRLFEGWRVPAAGASLRDTAALAVAASLVFDRASDLYQRLVVNEQKLLAIEFDPNDALHRDPGLLRYAAKLRPGTSFDDVVAAVDIELAKVGRGEVTLVKVDAAKRHRIHELVLALQTPSAVARALARWIALTGDPDSLNAYANELENVTPDDVARVTRNYLVARRRNVVTLTSKGETR